jgi:dethiobiotin synthetase
MTRGWFVTGTDTGVGKTHVACALVAGLAATGRRAVGMKPVASGARRTPAGLRHADAEQLLAAGNVAVAYDTVNPYCFEPAVAPHLAAEDAGVEMRLQTLLDAHAHLRALADCTVVEGAGGWRVPLGPRTTMSDLGRALGLPVLLVVGLRLGCLNHARLTLEAIRHDGVPFAGWVANACDASMEYRARNIEALTQILEEAPLATFPHQARGGMPHWPGELPPGI